MRSVKVFVLSACITHNLEFLLATEKGNETNLRFVTNDF